MELKNIQKRRKVKLKDYITSSMDKRDLDEKNYKTNLVKR